MRGLLAAAPALSSSSASIGLTGMLSSASGLSSSLGGIAQLTSQFEALGLSADKIPQFVSVVMSYFSANNDTQTTDLLKKGLSSIAG